MALSDLTSSQAVLDAIREFQTLGREAFLEKYGFGPARKYFVLYQGASIDSKALVGAAHGHQHPALGPLRPEEFSGGEQTVARKLRELGFVVTSEADGRRAPRTWTFCGKPSRYRVLEAVQNQEFDTWLVGKSDVRVGDRALIWQTRDKKGCRGVVGLAEVISDPVLMPDDSSPYWAPGADTGPDEVRVRVRYLPASGLPLWLADHPELGDLNAAKARGGTVFTTTDEQWDAVSALARVAAVNPDIDELETEIRTRNRGGQGFGLPAAARRAVELRAMEMVREHLETDWDDVVDTSANSSWDFHCRQGDEELYVEVKGTTTAGESVIMTRNEIKAARTKPYALFVVAGIVLEWDSGQPEASGGTMTVYHPWHPDHAVLEPIAYQVRLKS